MRKLKHVKLFEYFQHDEDDTNDKKSFNVIYNHNWEITEDMITFSLMSEHVKKQFTKKLDKRSDFTKPFYINDGIDVDISEFKFDLSQGNIDTGQTNYQLGFDMKYILVMIQNGEDPTFKLVAQNVITRFKFKSGKDQDIFVDIIKKMILEKCSNKVIFPYITEVEIDDRVINMRN